MGPFDVRDAARIAVIEDPQGAALGLWQPTEMAGAGLVNDVGALTMNQLNTSDPGAGPELLHRAVRMELPDGVGGARLLGHPERRGPERGHDADPGRLPGHARLARLLHLRRPGGVGAAASAENGGRVVVPATAIPAGRFLVATDPQGAAFALFEGEVDP